MDITDHNILWSLHKKESNLVQLFTTDSNIWQFSQHGFVVNYVQRFVEVNIYDIKYRNWLFQGFNDISDVLEKVYEALPVAVKSC